MKNDYFLSKREGLAVALEQLLHYNVWCGVSLDRSAFEDEALLKYFDANFDDPVNEEMEKVVATAVFKTIAEKNYISQESKKKLAQRVARQQVESFRNAKITYHEMVKGMSRHEAQKRRDENKMISRVARVDNTVKWGVMRAAKAGISYGIGAVVTALAPAVTIPAWVVAAASYAIISALPEKIKAPVKNGVGKAVDTVVKIVKNVAGELAKSAVDVGNKVIQTVEKIGHSIKESKVGKFLGRLLGRNRQK